MKYLVHPDNLNLKNENGQFTTVDVEQLKLANELARVYLDRQGRYRNIRPKDQKFFYKAAGICKELGETAEQYVERQLTAMSSAGARWLTAFASPHLRQEQDPKILGYRELTYYKSQLLLARELVTVYGLRQAMSDDSFPITPLIRYQVSIEHEDHDFARRFEQDARKELSDHPQVAEQLEEYNERRRKKV